MNVVRLVPPPSDGVFEGLASVIEGVISGGAPEPSWVAVDDGTERWAVMAAERPAVERAEGVVAAASEHSLVTAQKLGIGGAMWLPPAHLGAMDAFEAASSPSGAIRDFDPVVVELLEPGTPIQLVTFAELEFWRAQVGDRALRSLLTELAEAVDRPAAILPWPAAAMVGEGAGDILDAWTDLAAARLARCPDLEMAPVVVDSGDFGVLKSVYRCLLDGVPQTGDDGVPWKDPVHELPSGRQVGWWTSAGCDELPEEGLWYAAPASVNGTRYDWGFSGAVDPIVLREALTSVEIDECSDEPVVRMPGWAAQGLRSGSPAGLLARRLAESSSRLGVPLWIPNVDRDALQEVLRLPGTIWVDGPAVPRKEV